MHCLSPRHLAWSGGRCLDSGGWSCCHHDEQSGAMTNCSHCSIQAGMQHTARERGRVKLSQEGVTRTGVNQDKPSKISLKFNRGPYSDIYSRLRRRKLVRISWKKCKTTTSSWMFLHRICQFWKQPQVTVKLAMSGVGCLWIIAWGYYY